MPPTTPDADPSPPGMEPPRTPSATPEDAAPPARLWVFCGLALAVAALAFLAFGSLAEEVLEQAFAGVNQAVLLAIHVHAGPALDAAALVLAAVGSPVGVLGVGGLAIAWLVRRGHPSDAATLGAVLAGAGVLTWALKRAFHQPRPRLFPWLVDEASFSFPSGHACLSLALFGSIALWLALRGPRDARRWLGALACLALAGLVGASRLYLGVHWPTDVLAGYLVAVFWIATCMAARKWVAARRV